MDLRRVGRVVGDMVERQPADRVVKAARRMIDGQEIGALVADPVRQTAARGQAFADAVKILPAQRDHPGAGLRRDNPGRTTPARADFQHARAMPS